MWRISVNSDQPGLQKECQDSHVSKYKNKQQKAEVTPLDSFPIKQHQVPEWVILKFFFYTAFLGIPQKEISHGCKDSAMAKSICCSYRRPRFDFQHTCGGSQQGLTPVLKDLIPSFGL